MFHYSKPKQMAIGVGVLAATAALAILLAEPIATGNWRLEHFLLPAIVAITIATAHLTTEAFREFRIASGFGFLAVAIVGTVLTLYSSVGNQKEKSGEKAGAAEAHNQAITDKRAALVGEESKRDVSARLLEGARQQLQADCVHGRKPKGHCDGVRTNIGVYEAAVAGHEAVIRRYEAELQKLGGKHVARPKVEAVGEVASVLGFNRAKVEKVAETFEPFAYSLLFELCSIVAFGYGFGGNRRKPAAGNDNSMGTVSGTVGRAMGTVPPSSEPTPPKPRNRSSVHAQVFTKAAAEADVVQLLARGEQLPSQEALRARWGLKHRSLVSKWLSDFEARGLVVRHVEGRCKSIRRAIG